MNACLQFQMPPASPNISLHLPGLALEAELVPWDTAAFGFPVVAITALAVGELGRAEGAYGHFQDWLDVHNVRIASCRLPHGSLRESMFLEDQGFRFIEMVLHPHIEAAAVSSVRSDTLTIAPAETADLPALEQLAERAFQWERYHVDPRLDPLPGQVRYRRWVRNSLSHPRQRLLKLLDKEILVALFVVETMADRSIYWHLNAVSPELHGRGYGKRAWLSMLLHHKDEGASSISTTISARNTRVLNLYAQLGFRFLPPEMTFHWVRGTE